MSSSIAPVRESPVDLIGDPSDENPPKAGFGSRLLISLPDRIQLIALAAFLVVTAATTFGVFHEWLVLPAIVVLAVVLWFFKPRLPVPPTRLAFWGTLAAIVIAVVWFGANAPFVAEWLNPTRDPGLYLDHGLWFAYNPGSPIIVTPVERLIAGLPAFSADLGNIHSGTAGIIDIQGGDLLPGIVGAADWVGGVKGTLLVNLALGSFGMLALYGFARRIIGPLWAIVPELALGFSVAYMFFARGTYSEIIMLTVGLAALTWLVSGVKSLSIRDFAIAGVFVGIATGARIDGVLVGMGALLVFAVAGIGFVPKIDRGKMFLGGAAFAVFGFGSTYLGYYGLIRNKIGYVNTLGEPSKALWAAAAALVVLYAICWVIGLAATEERMRPIWRVIAPIAGGLVLAIMIFWLSRPLWYVGHFAGRAGFATIEGLQKAAGVPLDGTRSYEEQTLAWIGWYFGWPTVVLAVFGFALLVWLGIRWKNLPLLISALAPLVVAAVYFTDVSITPDQVWAFRRLIPVVTPGFLIAAIVPIVLVWRHYTSRWIKAAALVAAALVAFGPIATWNGLLIVRDGGNQVAMTAAVCKAVGDSPEVLFVRDSAPVNYPLTIKTECRTNVISVWHADMTQANLEKLHARTGDIPVIGYNQGAMPLPRGASGPDLTVTVPNWERSLTHLPKSIVSNTFSLYFGELRSNGSVVAQ